MGAEYRIYAQCVLMFIAGFVCSYLVFIPWQKTGDHKVDKPEIDLSCLNERRYGGCVKMYSGSQDLETGNRQEQHWYFKE